MGTSTDEIMIFGIDLGEELSELFEILSPFFESKTNSEDNCPVDLVKHYSLEYPMYILAVRGTEIRNSIGYPRAFNQEELKVSEEQIQALKDFCEKCDVPYSEPKWYLVSISS